MSHRIVTEQDFRMPEFRTAKLEDYEFRADGKVVRKDRWEAAVQSIRFLVGIETREFEIDDVVAKVQALAEADSNWTEYTDDDEELPERLDVQLNDGSILVNVWFEAGVLFWNPEVRIKMRREDIRAWRPHQEAIPHAYP